MKDLYTVVAYVKVLYTVCPVISLKKRVRNIKSQQSTTGSRFERNTTRISITNCSILIIITKTRGSSLTRQNHSLNYILSHYNPNFCPNVSLQYPTTCASILQTTSFHKTSPPTLIRLLCVVHKSHLCDELQPPQI